MKDRASGKSRGFGFVTYWSAADAQRVLEGNHVVDGRRCEVRGRVLQPLHARHKCDFGTCICTGSTGMCIH